MGKKNKKWLLNQKNKKKKKKNVQHTHKRKMRYHFFLTWHIEKDLKVL